MRNTFRAAILAATALISTAAYADGLNNGGNFRGITNNGALTQNGNETVSGNLAAPTTYFTNLYGPGGTSPALTFSQAGVVTTTHPITAAGFTNTANESISGGLGVAGGLGVTGAATFQTNVTIANQTNGGGFVVDGTSNGYNRWNKFTTSGTNRWLYGINTVAENIVVVATSAAQSAAGTTLTFASTTGITAGMFVSGASVPSGAIVSSVTSTTVVLSAATTAVLASGATLTFYANTGSNFYIDACNDVGTIINVPMIINRATGVTTFLGITNSGNETVAGTDTVTGLLTASGGISNGGNETIAGTLNVAGAATLAAATVNTVTGAGTAATIAAGAGAGTSPTVAVTTAFANDGHVAVTSGTAPAAGILATITFPAFTRAPSCVFSPANAAAAALAASVYVTTTTTTLVFNSASAVTASTAYNWNYVCQG